LLEVLDEFARSRVKEGAFDEIFVGRTPILMGVEPTSLCWVLGRIADNREGSTWAQEFQGFPSLEHAITDAGSGLVSGLKLASATRSQPLEHSLDVFHTLQEGSRAWRATEGQLWKLHEQARDLWKPLERRERQGLSLQGLTHKARAASQRAEEALEAAVHLEAAWHQVQGCLELFTPDGQLNTHAAARAKLDQWLPGLKGSQWAKSVASCGTAGGRAVSSRGSTVSSACNKPDTAS
jgi:hypothetical protein